MLQGTRDHWTVAHEIREHGSIPLVPAVESSRTTPTLASFARRRTCRRDWSTASIFSPGTAAKTTANGVPSSATPPSQWFPGDNMPWAVNYVRENGRGEPSRKRALNTRSSTKSLARVYCRMMWRRVRPLFAFHRNSLASVSVSQQKSNGHKSFGVRARAERIYKSTPGSSRAKSERCISCDESSKHR